MKIALKKLALIAALTSIGMSAQAEEGGYVGLGLGYATQKFNHTDLKIEGLNSDLSWHQSKDKLGAKVYVGYQFNDNFALEGGYSYLNKAKAAAGKSFFLEDVELASFRAHLETQGHVFSLAAVGMIPISNDFSFFAKAGGGIYYSKTKVNYNASMPGVSESSEETRTQKTGVPVFGAGFEYAINKGMKMRFEYENFGRPNLGELQEDRAGFKITPKLKRADMFSIGLRSTFN